MRYLLLSLILVLLLPFAYADDKPCTKNWSEIEANLTNNRGCNNREFPVYQSLCIDISKCIVAYDICVVRNNKVLMGNSMADFPPKTKNIHFGLNQTKMTVGHCAMGVLSQAPGEDVPGWSFAMYTTEGARGQWLNVIDTQMSLAKFLETTLNAEIPKAR